MEVNKKYAIRFKYMGHKLNDTITYKGKTDQGILILHSPSFEFLIKEEDIITTNEIK